MLTLLILQMRYTNRLHNALQQKLAQPPAGNTSSETTKKDEEIAELNQKLSEAEQKVKDTEEKPKSTDQNKETKK